MNLNVQHSSSSNSSSSALSSSPSSSASLTVSVSSSTLNGQGSIRAKDVALKLYSLPGVYRCLIVNERRILLFIRPGTSPLPTIPDEFKPIVFLVEGQEPGQPFSTTTQDIL